MVSIKKSVLVLGLLTLAGAGLEARAEESANINTHGAACNPFNAAEATDIDYLVSGVRTIATSARRVICPVPRHPVSGPGQTFWVDGANSPGRSTLCSVYSHSYQGEFRSAISFSESTATYDHPASLSAVGFYDYVSVVCNLPASGGGVLFGVIAEDN
jgi:hypothetical protein